MENIKYKVVYQWFRYEGIEKFDCRIVSLLKQERGAARFFTVIPISPKEYRKEHQTRAGVFIETQGDWTRFYITSDWGETYTVAIHNSLSEEIEIATQAAKDQQLLITKEPETKEE